MRTNILLSAGVVAVGLGITGAAMAQTTYPVEPAPPPTAAEGRDQDGAFTGSRALGPTEVPEYPTEPEAPPTAPEAQDGSLGAEGTEMPVPEYSPTPEAPPTAPTGQQD